MSVKKYVVVHSRAGLGITKGQILSMNPDRIKMLLDHGLIEEMKSNAVSEKQSAPNGAGSEIAKSKK